jgi:prepilin-type N-terminal cleavage/methylation domain-containing protein
MKHLRKQTNRAVTLTELLVVVAIISLLATLAVPVYVSQIQRARLSTAQHEVRIIAEAEQQVAILHGYYVPIHILDNIPNQESGVSTSGPRDDFDNLDNPAQHYLIDVYRSLDDQRKDSQDNLNQADTNDRVNRLIEGWQGPFLNPKRVRYDGEDLGNPGTGAVTLDLVVDPWGNPYRFYTDLGLLGNSNAPTSPQQIIDWTWDNGDLNNSNEIERFDRFAILSFGPDSVTGYETPSTNQPVVHGDDIYYEFSGMIGNETLYRGY